MKLRKIMELAIIVLFSCPIVTFAGNSYAETDLFEMSLEELAEVKVVTAGRQLQSISEAPAAMSVVTAEDIRQLGATQLSEALRMVVGVHLGRTNSFFSLAGGIRGFHKLPANKFVFLIDGIPTSFEVYGIPELYQLPVTLEEIEKIEILRGPGSSLYGPNAMFGVINVITKKPADTKGTSLTVKAGEDHTVMGSLMHGGSTANKLDYRIAAGWKEAGNDDFIAWASDPEQRYWKLNTSLDYHLDANSTLSFFAGYIQAEEMDILLESTGPIDFSEGNTVKAVLGYSSKSPDITIKAHLKHMDENEGYSLGKKQLYFKMGERGVELQHRLPTFGKSTLIWGANLSQKYADGPSIDGRQTHENIGLFLDNTYAFTDQVSVNTGIRYDDQSHTGGTVSHRLSFMYDPHPSHHFRFTWGSSYRNPDFIESHYNRLSPYQEGTYLRVFGQEDNDPEKAATYELAYIGRFLKKFGVKANLFYSRLDDFIYFIQDGDPYHDETVGGMVIPFPFMNIGKAEQYGAEFEIDYQITKWLNAKANYTYLDQQEKDDRVKQLLMMTPQHMANGQLRARFKNGLSTNFTVHYKDVTRWRQYMWESPEGNTVAGGLAESHIFATLRLGYEFELAGNPAEVGIAAFNLFNTTFDEYPLDTSDVSRRITGCLSIRM